MRGVQFHRSVRITGPIFGRLSAASASLLIINSVRRTTYTLGFASSRTIHF